MGVDEHRRACHYVFAKQGATDDEQIVRSLINRNAITMRESDAKKLIDHRRSVLVKVHARLLFPSNASLPTQRTRKPSFRPNNI